MALLIQEGLCRGSSGIYRFYDLCKFGFPFLKLPIISTKMYWGINGFLEFFLETPIWGLLLPFRSS